MFSSAEEKLLKQLEYPSAADASAFFDQAAIVITSARSDLLKYTHKQASTLSDEDVEDIVSDAMEIALLKLHDQYLSKPVSFPYERKHGISVLGWICRIIGKPYAGTASGLITNKLKSNKNQHARTIPLDDYDLERNVVTGVPQAFHTVDFDSGPEEIEDILQTLNAVLAAKKPREEFVFRVTTGLHDHDELTPVTLKKLARTVGCNHTEQNRIKSVSAALLSSDETPSRRSLDQKSAGLLLGIQSRQVRNILSSVREEVRGEFAAKQIGYFGT